MTLNVVGARPTTPQKMKALVSHLGEKIKKACVSRNQVCVPRARVLFWEQKWEMKGCVWKNVSWTRWAATMRHVSYSTSYRWPGGRFPFFRRSRNGRPYVERLRSAGGLCLHFDPTRLDQCVHYNCFIYLFIHCSKVMWWSFPRYWMWLRKDTVRARAPLRHACTHK